MAYLGKAVSRFQVVPLSHSMEERILPIVSAVVAETAVPVTTSNKTFSMSPVSTVAASSPHRVQALPRAKFKTVLARYTKAFTSQAT